jgi:adenylate cyclase
MVTATLTRRLTAILAADVAGYSRLISVDEAGTLARLKSIRKELVDPKITEYRGRVVKTTGDGILTEFKSVVDAVLCAVDVQKAMARRNAELRPEQRIEFRVGINLGEIVVDGRDILGDGVNVAARLETMSEPGAICISSRVHEEIVGKVSLMFHDLGDQALKNIPRPVHVFRIGLDDSGAQPAPPDSSRARLALPDKPSIAVLPFANMSGDGEQEYFADGITEDIITALSRIHWLFVIARNSTFVYKGRAVDVKQVARDLGVRYVLEGSVRKIGNRVRITAQLVDTTSGAHHWAERYDRDLTDIFALQDEITRRVAAAIEPRLLAAEGIRAQKRSPEQLDAWDLVMHARSSLWRLTKQDTDAAIAMLRRAVETYPEYGPAYSMLAFALLLTGYIGWNFREPRLDEAAELAHRATELDDGDPWAHWAMGYYLFMNRQIDEAAAAFQRVLDLNPNFAAAHGFFGWALVFDGRCDEAIPELDLAIRMDPNDPQNAFFNTGLSGAHYLCGRFVEAIGFGRKVVQQRPGFAAGHRILCASLAQAGHLGEAKAVLARLKQLQPGLSIAWIEQNVPYTPGPMAQFVEGMRKAGLT